VRSPRDLGKAADDRALFARHDGAGAGRLAAAELAVVLAELGYAGDAGYVGGVLEIYGDARGAAVLTIDRGACGPGRGLGPAHAARPGLQAGLGSRASRNWPATSGAARAGAAVAGPRAEGRPAG
jgi:hypothetical protein